MNYKEIINESVAYEADFNSAKKSIDDQKNKKYTQLTKIKKQIEKLETKRSKLWNKYIYWTDSVVVPLAKELNTFFPEYKYELLGPFGIRSSVSIHFFKKTQKEIGRDAYFSRENLFSLTLIPIDIANGIYHYETGEKTNEFRPGTLGEVNGCNNVTKEIEGIEELVEFLKNKQQ